MSCSFSSSFFFFFFFFNDTATTEIYTLSLHDALPISAIGVNDARPRASLASTTRLPRSWARSEEHTSELQSQSNLVCRLLLEKKKNQNSIHNPSTNITTDPRTKFSTTQQLHTLYDIVT